mmetsp:Transcript_5272/g.12552  ORF Transcript_5272/g.12552 Transcript_5272/m.12552 type:complete len:492 (+) Transcript_5272:1298-2773(+)
MKRACYFASAIGINENIETGTQRILHSICLHLFFQAFELHIKNFCSSSSFSRRKTIFWFLDLHCAGVRVPIKSATSAQSLSYNFIASRRSFSSSSVHFPDCFPPFVTYVILCIPRPPFFFLPFFFVDGAFLKVALDLALAFAVGVGVTVANSGIPGTQAASPLFSGGSLSSTGSLFFGVLYADKGLPNGTKLVGAAEAATGSATRGTTGAGIDAGSRAARDKARSLRSAPEMRSSISASSVAKPCHLGLFETRPLRDFRTKGSFGCGASSGLNAGLDAGRRMDADMASSLESSLLAPKGKGAPIDAGKCSCCGGETAAGPCTDESRTPIVSIPPKYSSKLPKKDEGMPPTVMIESEVAEIKGEISIGTGIATGGISELAFLDFRPLFFGSAVESARLFRPGFFFATLADDDDTSGASTSTVSEPLRAGSAPMARGTTAGGEERGVRPGPFPNPRSAQVVPSANFIPPGPNLTPPPPSSGSSTRFRRPVAAG